MNSPTHHKVTANHLQREAYLYVRQSSLRQVIENTESTKRQYALRERAVALGWPLDRVVVIDSDLGQSGASTDREGFQKLVADVGLRRVGVVLGLEVSRLARNSVDWQRLLEICALTDTLILDEDGIYNPGHFNDRLLLGLKGTMSEAELHVIRSRLQGGILNKANRGELKVRLPVGLVYGADEKVVLDPDQHVQAAIRSVFQAFRRTGSAMATVRSLQARHILLPWRLHAGPHKGELAWGPALHWRVMNFLKNPRYAGAFAYGRRRGCQSPEGRRVSQPELPRDDWLALFPDSHPGYISWTEHEENLRQLRRNAQAYGDDRRTPPREGPALLQGLAICGICGRRMSVYYPSTRRGQKVRVIYRCMQAGIDNATSACQTISGNSIDQAIADLLVEAVTPLALEVALNVQDELNARADEVDKLRRKQVERVRYEAELSQRRYLRVDPDNRLVADSLEADWNQKLRELADAKEDYERQRRADSLLLDEQKRAQVMALATDFPRLWKDPNTPLRERKRLVRLLIEDVTLVKGAKDVTVHIRFRGGATRTLRLPRPLPAPKLRKTGSAIIQELDSLLELHTDAQAADILNRSGLRPAVSAAFNSRIIRSLRKEHGLADHGTRLRSRGFLTSAEIAIRLGVPAATVATWRRAGILHTRPSNDHGEFLFEPPNEEVLMRLNHESKGLAQPALRSLATEGV